VIPFGNKSGSLSNKYCGQAWSNELHFFRVCMLTWTTPGHIEIARKNGYVEQTQASNSDSLTHLAD